MKVVMRGTCSECYQTCDLVLTEKTKEIVCPTCGHAVPALEDRAMESLGKDQGKRRMLTVVAVIFFLISAALLVAFATGSGGGDPGAAAGAPGAIGALPSSAQGMLIGSIVTLLISLVVGAMASSRSYVCEF